MKPFWILSMCLTAGAAMAEDLTIDGAIVPLAPPGVMAHAAFMTIENTGAAPRSLIGVRAAGYAMAHLHQSTEAAGIATMSAVHQVQIAPGQRVTLAHGGLHIMLMRPAAPLAEGDAVALELEFANGAVLPVTAVVTRLNHGS